MKKVRQYWALSNGLKIYVDEVGIIHDGESERYDLWKLMTDGGYYPYFISIVRVGEERNFAAILLPDMSTIQGVLTDEVIK